MIYFTIISKCYYQNRFVEQISAIMYKYIDMVIGSSSAKLALFCIIGR